MNEIIFVPKYTRLHNYFDGVFISHKYFFFREYAYKVFLSISTLAITIILILLLPDILLNLFETIYQVNSNFLFLLITVVLATSVILFYLCTRTKKIIIRDDSICIVKVLGILKSKPIGDLIYYDYTKGLFLINGYLIDARHFRNRDELADTFSQYSAGRNITYHVNYINDNNIAKIAFKEILSLLILIIGYIVTRLYKTNPETSTSNMHRGVYKVLADVLGVGPSNTYLFVAIVLILMVIYVNLTIFPKASEAIWSEACETVMYAKIHETPNSRPIHKWPE